MRKKKDLQSIAKDLDENSANDLYYHSLEQNDTYMHYNKMKRLIVEIENDLNSPIKKVLTNIYLPTKYRNKINLAYQHYEKAIYGERDDSIRHSNSLLHTSVDSASRKVDKNVSKLMRKGKTKLNEFKKRRNE